MKNILILKKYYKENIKTFRKRGTFLCFENKILIITFNSFK